MSMYMYACVCVYSHVVFGKVIEGMDVVMKVEAAGSQSGKPSEKVVIVDSGELKARDGL